MPVPKKAQKGHLKLEDKCIRRSVFISCCSHCFRYHVTLVFAQPSTEIFQIAVKTTAYPGKLLYHSYTHSEFMAPFSRKTWEHMCFIIVIYFTHFHWGLVFPVWICFWSWYVSSRHGFHTSSLVDQATFRYSEPSFIYLVSLCMVPPPIA